MRIVGKRLITFKPKEGILKPTRPNKYNISVTTKEGRKLYYQRWAADHKRELALYGRDYRKGIRRGNVITRSMSRKSVKNPHLRKVQPQI